MSRAHFFSIEGELARPSLMPLLGLPFGREWALGAPALRPRMDYRARLRTRCIDVTAPHHACQWASRIASPREACQPHAKARPSLVLQPTHGPAGERLAPTTKRALQRPDTAHPKGSLRSRRSAGRLRVVVVAIGLGCTAAAGLLMVTAHGPAMHDATPQPVPQTRPIELMRPATPAPMLAESNASGPPPKRETHAARTTHAARAAHAAPKLARAHAPHPKPRSSDVAAAQLPDDAFAPVALSPTVAHPVTPHPQIDWMSHLTQRRLTDDEAFLR